MRWESNAHIPRIHANFDIDGILYPLQKVICAFFDKFVIGLIIVDIPVASVF